MKRQIQKLEFYITNVCNLACPDCNRFNDHNFRGHQFWQDYEHDYQEWGRRLDVSGLVILGGEPLLNPSILDWIHGLNRCFGKNVQVLTNGTRLNKTPGLYEALAEFRADSYWTNWIGISVHNRADLDRMIQETRIFLRGDIQEHHGRQARDHTGYPISHGADYTFVDKNNVSVRLWIQDSFYPAAVHREPPREINGSWQPGALTVYNNDPVLAHEACGFVQWKNYHMIRGRLHKCGPCVLMAEFDEQNPLAISETDRHIMRSYQGLSPWADDKTQHKFFKRLDSVIPQCKFCPTQAEMQNTTIAARLKKKGSTGTFG
jgi:hypothetical protein